MKYFVLATVLSLSVPFAYAQNLSDNLDANNMPAKVEERENELINSRDSVDANVIPSELEQREEAERVESDVIQTDDAEKTYDPVDSEVDE